MRILILLLVPTAALAQLGREPVLPEVDRAMVGLGRAAALTLAGSARLVGGRADGVEVAAEDPLVGDSTDADAFGTYRVRLRPAVVIPGTWLFRLYRLAADAELVGLATGGETRAGLESDPRQIYRDDRTGVRLSQAYALAAGEHMALKLGLVRSHFGLGIVANDGEDAELGSVRDSPFGFAREGDRNVRAQLAVFPLRPGVGGDGRSTRPLTLALAADAIYDDDSARWRDGDRAYQLLGGAFVDVGDLRVGAGLEYRTQDYDEGGETDVWVAVATARYDLLHAPLFAWVEGEMAGYFGETTLAQSVFHEAPTEVFALGGVARAGARWDVLEGVFEFGYASGDDNPFDDQVRSFTFDRSHRVGMLMFGEALRAHSAVTAHNIEDETFRAQPPRGYDAIPTGGAVRDAIYLNPRVAYAPVRGASVYLGYLYGRTEEPATDTFRSGVAGGTSTGPRGAVDAYTLGHEVDVGVSYRRRVWALELSAKAELAWFAPGEVFDTAEGDAADDMTGAWLQLEAAW